MVICLLTPKTFYADYRTIIVEPSIVDIIPRIKAGVVHISTKSWQGSGFAIAPNIVMTARHCVENVTDFTITTDDGHELHATRAISSKKHDIGFIYIDDHTCVTEGCEFEYPCGKTALQGGHKVELQPLKLGSITECQLGEKVVTIGSPYGKVNFNSVTLGIISGLDRNYDPLNDSYSGDYGWSIAFQTDSPGHPGNSGCAIFTTDGVVRGILVGGFTPSLIIAMPVDVVLEEIELVKQKFIMDKYYKEETPEDPYYNYREDTEYYTL
jgi:serine protease Do